MNDVVYDGFGFVAAGCVLTNIDHMTLPKRDNELEDLVNRSGSVLVQSRLTTKPITVEGYYDGSSNTDAQVMYDTLAAALNREARLLEIPHAGSKRYYTATPQNIILQEPNGLNRLTFSMEFVVPEGSAQDQTTTQLLSTTITTSTATTPLTVIGSVTARPLLTVTFTSVTGGTSGSVSIRNARDFIGLTFNRTFVSGDVVTIDSANYQIYINGVLTEPNGRMPTWATGSGGLYYSDTFTARSVSITGTYNIRNL